MQLKMILVFLGRQMPLRRRVVQRDFFSSVYYITYILLITEFKVDSFKWHIYFKKLIIQYFVSLPIY